MELLFSSTMSESCFNAVWEDGKKSLLSNIDLVSYLDELLQDGDEYAKSEAACWLAHLACKSLALKVAPARLIAPLKQMMVKARQQYGTMTRHCRLYHACTKKVSMDRMAAMQNPLLTALQSVWHL